MTKTESTYGFKLKRIERIIDYLNVTTSISARLYISHFYVNHIDSNFNSNKIMFMLLGLAKMHEFSESADMSENNVLARAILRYIYSAIEINKSDLEQLAYILVDMRIAEKLSTKIIDINEYNSPFINGLALTIHETLSSFKKEITIISKGKDKRSSIGNYDDLGLGFYQDIGKKPSQEDTLTWSNIDNSILANHSAEEIGIRLWTAYHNLNTQDLKDGTTACTTICTNDKLITATLSDTTAYAVIYYMDKTFEVKMLNKRIRHPNDPDEKLRIQAAHGFVYRNRVSGRLSPPRNIGNRDVNGICADADIDIFDLTSYASAIKIQVMLACDGFLEPLVYEEKRADSNQNCEEFLTRYLHAIALKYQAPLIDLSEYDIAYELTKEAIKNGSQDNVTLLVQTIVKHQVVIFNGLLGVYDGHGGEEASEYVADNITQEFNYQLKITLEEYAEQYHSVFNNAEAYIRDNGDIIVNLDTHQAMKMGIK